MEVCIKAALEIVVVDQIASRRAAAQICARFQEERVKARVCVSQTGYQVEIAGLDLEDVERRLRELQIEAFRA
jgi:hypothetical protein